MSKTKDIVICAFFAAVICITAPFSIPVGVVPITMALFSIPLAAFVGGSKRGAISTLVYMMIGLAGMPVFSGFKGGFSVIMSPTGGFALSYVLMAIILGRCVKTNKISRVILFCTESLLVCYVFGTAWFMFLTKSDLIKALCLCIFPFIPFDIVKLALAYIVGTTVRKRLVRAGRI